MATIKYCDNCQRRVKAEWMWGSVPMGIVVLIMLSCGMLLPLLLLVPKQLSRYVCSRCLEDM